jgi:hypothetical protein
MSTSVTKYGSEASNLDSIVVCRKSTPSHAVVDVEAAAASAYDSLAILAKNGIRVGAGDVRSVIRGRVLSIYTYAPGITNLDELATKADELAQFYIDLHIADSKRREPRGSD